MTQQFTDWRKSTHSSSSAGNCVEIALTQETIGVRDSKGGDTGPILTVCGTAWSAFVRSVAAFDHGPI